MRSMIPEASLKIFRAAALSPAAIALLTLLIALVRAERRLALCLRRFSAWRAALRAPFVFAMRNPERKGAIVRSEERRVGKEWRVRWAGCRERNEKRKGRRTGNKTK